MAGNFRTTLYLILAAVGLLLLIACSNVANLLLARATAREREFAIRAALGSNRARLVSQLLIESLLLAMLAGGLGIGVAWSGLQTLISLVPPDIIAAETVVTLNGKVLLFAVAVAVMTSVVFGLIPALQVTRRDVNDGLRDTGKGAGGSNLRNNRLRNAVVVVEVALSFTLLVSSAAPQPFSVSWSPSAVPRRTPTASPRTLPDSTGSERILPPFGIETERSAWCGGGCRNQRASSLWRNSQRH